MLPDTRDDDATLGVAPSAAAARQSKRILAENTLSSARSLFDGIIETGFATRTDLSGAVRAVERLKALLDTTERPGDVVEPVFYEWYFRAIDHLKRRQFAELARLAPAASAVAAMPLIRAGALDHRRGEPLDVDLLEHGRLILSEREPATGAIPVVGPTARLTTRGVVLYVEAAGNRSLKLDWPALDGHGRYAISGTPISFWQTGYALQRIIAVYQRNLSRIHEDVKPYQLISPQEFETDGLCATFTERFAAGLELIRSCWPELYDETCVLTDYFTLIHGVPFIGGSSISCLGVSFFKLFPEWSDVCFADHIVHEAAHQRLHVEFEIEPALTNGDFTGTISPIRPDPRPLHGVLHATFVLLRLSLFFERMMEAKPSLEAERRFHRHVLGLYRGLEQLERYARWNPRGEHLYSLMCRQANRLRTVLPRPSADYYDKLGPDYEPVSALAAADHD
jgi:HEXXH motif-containing protein